MWAGLAVVAAPSFVVSLDAMALYVAFGDWLPFVLLSGIGVSMVLPQLGWR